MSNWSPERRLELIKVASQTAVKALREHNFPKVFDATMAIQFMAAFPAEFLSASEEQLQEHINYTSPCPPS